MIDPLFEISRAEHVIAIAAIRGVTRDIQAAVQIEVPVSDARLAVPAIHSVDFDGSVHIILFVWQRNRGGADGVRMIIIEGVAE